MKGGAKGKTEIGTGEAYVREGISRIQELTKRSICLGRWRIGTEADIGKLENEIGMDERDVENRGREIKFNQSNNEKVLLFENRRREGELDGNTVYWEYKKG